MDIQSLKRPIGSVTIWASGGTPSRDKKDYWKGSVPWISASTLKETEIRTSNQFLTLDAVRAGSKMAPVNSTLLLVRGSALHNGIRTGLVTSPVAFNQDVKALIPKHDLIPKYLTHVIRGNESELLKLVTSAGNTAGVLDTKVVQSFEIFLPDKHEQRRLVKIFDDMDNFINTLERLITKKQAIKEGMMQQLLSGSTRLPGFTAGWRNVKLGAVAQMGSGGTPPSTVAGYYGGGIPWVSISDMTSSGKYISQTQNTLSANGLAASAARLYETDVVLYAMYASIGECSLAVGRVSSSQAILGIRVGSQLDREFLYYYLLSIKLRVRLLGQQGTQSNLNASIVRNFDIPLPKIDEQTAIARALRDVDTEIEKLKHQLVKTYTIKVGMMQQLLTGRTRLSAKATS